MQVAGVILMVEEVLQKKQYQYLSIILQEFSTSFSAECRRVDTAKKILSIKYLFLLTQVDKIRI